MTLAVFEDSGWYTVDYSQAEDFLWGKGSNLVSVLHAVTNRYEILTVILVSYGFSSFSKYYSTPV